MAESPDCKGTGQQTWEGMPSVVCPVCRRWVDTDTDGKRTWIRRHPK